MELPAGAVLADAAVAEAALTAPVAQRAGRASNDAGEVTRRQPRSIARRRQLDQLTDSSGEVLDLSEKASDQEVVGRYRFHSSEKVGCSPSPWTRLFL